MLPDTPDTCSILIDPLVEMINDTVEDLKYAQDCLAFTVGSACSDLTQLVQNAIEDNQQLLEDTTTAIDDIIDDLFTVEGLPED